MLMIGCWLADSADASQHTLPKAFIGKADVGMSLQSIACSNHHLLWRDVLVSLDRCEVAKCKEPRV